MKNINCVFDGACIKNPGGKIGIGAAIFEDRKLIIEISTFFPAKLTNTNNVAEYMAVQWVINELIERKLTNEKIKIIGDSQLVIKQLGSSNWRIKLGPYVQIALEVKYLLYLFKDITFELVAREKNTYADKLSKKMLM